MCKPSLTSTPVDKDTSKTDSPNLLKADEMELVNGSWGAKTYVICGLNETGIRTITGVKAYGSYLNCYISYQIEDEIVCKEILSHKKSHA